ncbi:MAG: hypothetical protein ACE5GH_03260 [Fidelibacterota bacterium]
MDFSYWIIILVLYLLSQWARRRMRGRAPRPSTRSPSGEPASEERLEEERFPAWLRDLGFPELREEEEVEPAEEGPPVEPIPPTTLRERMEAFDERVPLGPSAREPQVPPTPERPAAPPGVAVTGVMPERSLGTLGRSRGTSRQRVTQDQPRRLIGIRFGDRIYDPGSLRDVIVLREILGPPRATRPYTHHDYL